MLVLSLVFVPPAAAEEWAEPVEAVELVDPFDGTEAGGNTVPGASVPFGFVSLSPHMSRAMPAAMILPGRC